MLAEHKDQGKNYVILRDKHQRDKKTGNKEGIEMTSTQRALNRGNQNDMINQRYNDAGNPSLTEDIKRMVSKLNKGQ